MKKNKKSEVSNYLIGLIILLIALVILLMFYARTFDIFKSNKNKDICALAVRTQAAMKIKGSDIINTIFKSPAESLSDIPCPIIYRKINGEETYPGYKKNIDDNIKQQVMQRMCDCFFTFGEGRLELFETKYSQQKYCVICHHLEFEGGAKDRKLTNFLDYLAANDCIIKGKKVNARDYLRGFSTDEQYEEEYFQEEREKHELLKEGADTIHTDTEYSTMFLYTKKGFIQEIWASVLGASGSFLTGFAGVLLVLPEPTITKAAGIGILSGVGGGVAGYGLGEERSAAWDSLTWLYPFETKALNALDCEYLPAMQEKQE
ncbi:hypothetical protein CMO93_03265 [Candidatus Woesearchaeota archaeon]|nr:hypothetical protein [Candidatus Woesearchaeota archaeon]|tara:strand:- start:1965 stop:2918 length:954 start_codon:yes stop_codon:yes gene_type:complete